MNLFYKNMRPFLLILSSALICNSKILKESLDKVSSNSLFDQDLCCLNSTIPCSDLGNGICNEPFNKDNCGWDLGDCLKCAENCYFHMLTNGICDASCLVPECSFDYKDCSQLNPESDCDIYQIIVNSHEVSISSCEKHQLFEGILLQNIGYISGQIQVDETMKIILKMDLEIQGSLIISGYLIMDITSITIKIHSDLDLHISDLQFNEKFNVVITPRKSSQFQISDTIISANADKINLAFKLKTSTKCNLSFTATPYALLNSASLILLENSTGFVSKFNSDQVSINFKIFNSQFEAKGITIANTTYTDSEIFSFTNSGYSLISELHINNVVFENAKLLSLDNTTLTISSTSLENIHSNGEFLVKSLTSNLSIKNTEILSPDHLIQSLLYSSSSNIKFSNTTIALQFQQSPIISFNTSLFFENSKISDCTYSPLVSNSGETNTLISSQSNFSSCSTQDLPEFRFLQDTNNSEDTQTNNTLCPDGEVMYEKCEKCHNGTYIVHQFLNDTCFKCPQNMTCTNGTVAPVNGTYRFPGDFKLIFRECPLKEACNRNTTNKDNLAVTGCKKGYQDHFCHNCNDDFTKVSVNQCASCPTQLVNAGIIILLILVISVFTYYLVKTTVSSTFEPGEMYSITLKIFMNYCQVIYLCLQYKIKWPTSFQGLTSQSSNAPDSESSLTGYYFSIKCLVKDHYTIPEKNLFYYRLNFVILLPLILFIGSFLVLFLMKVVNKTHNIKHYKTVIFIVPFLLVYPTVISYALSPLACQSLSVGKPDNFDEFYESLNNTYPDYLIENRAITCNWPEHYQYSIAPTMIGVLLWGLAVPFCIFVNLYQMRKNLYKDEAKIKYGFLFFGYKHSRYYWEFIILFKKLCIILLTIITQSTVNDYLQSTSVITFLVVFFILQMRFNPYITKELNDLEAFASFASIVTIMCGIIYSDSANQPYVYYLMPIIIFFVNAFFVVWWLRTISKELLAYLVKSVDYLKKKLYKKDGFDDEISKAFSTVKCIYIKENQQLYTQINDMPPVIENYLGDTRTINEFYNEIVKMEYSQYENNEVPIVRSIFRRRSQMFK